MPNPDGTPTEEETKALFGGLTAGTHPEDPVAAAAADAALTAPATGYTPNNANGTIMGGYTDSNGNWVASSQIPPQGSSQERNYAYDYNGTLMSKGDPFAGTSYGNRPQDHTDARDFMYGRNPDYVQNTNEDIRANAAQQQASLLAQGGVAARQGAAAEQFGMDAAATSAAYGQQLSDIGGDADQYARYAAGNIAGQATMLSDIGQSTLQQGADAQGRTGPVANYDAANAMLGQSGGALNKTAGSLARASTNVNQAGTSLDRAGANADALTGIEATEGPSAAQAQLQAGLNASEASNLAMARSGRGFGGSASAMSQAADQNAAATQQAGNAASVLRAQETAAFRQRQAANLTGAAGINTAGAAGRNAMAGANTAVAGANTAVAGQFAQNAGQVSQQATTQAQLDAQQRALNDQTQLGLYGQGLGAINQGQAGLTSAGNLGLQGIQQNAQAVQAGAGAAAQGAGIGLQGAAQGMQGTAMGMQGTQLGGAAYAQGEQLANVNVAGQQNADLANEHAMNERYGVDAGVALAGEAARNQLIGGVVQGAATLAGGMLAGPAGAAGGAAGGGALNQAIQSDITAKKDIRAANGRDLVVPTAPDTASLDASEYGQQVRPAYGYGGGWRDGDQLAGPESYPHRWDADPFASAVEAAPAYSYQYKDPHAPGADDGTFYGPMAQDLAKTPVGRTVVKPGPDGKLAVDTGRLSLVNTGALNSHQREIDRLNAEVDALRKAPDAQSAGPTSYAQPRAM